MPKMIFLNLPVADLAKAVVFYESVGAVKDGRFSDGSAAMMTFSDAIHVMLLTHNRFREFSPKPVADARKTAEVLICISADSRADVDGMVEKAASAGASVDPCPTQDYGFMYGRSFEDPDGHIWEVAWMNVEAAEAAMAGNRAAA